MFILPDPRLDLVGNFDIFPAWRFADFLPRLVCGPNFCPQHSGKFEPVFLAPPHRWRDLRLAIWPVTMMIGRLALVENVVSFLSDGFHVPPHLSLKNI
jgi:hypothetical protein